MLLGERGLVETPDPSEGTLSNQALVAVKDVEGLADAQVPAAQRLPERDTQAGLLSARV